MRFVWADGGKSKYYKSGNFNDHVVRAIGNATGLDYIAIRRELNILNRSVSKRRSKYNSIFDITVIEKFLNEMGWKYCNRRLRFNEKSLPYAISIVFVNGHLTCTYHGAIYDTEKGFADDNSIIDGYFKRIDGVDEMPFCERELQNEVAKWKAESKAQSSQEILNI